jgi:hypothetical protein
MRHSRREEIRTQTQQLACQITREVLLEQVSRFGICLEVPDQRRGYSTA